MGVLLALALVAVPGLAVVVAVGPPLVMRRRGRWAALPVGLWVAALVLLGAWVLAEYRAGVGADETGTAGDVLAPGVLAWWWAAVALGGLALVLASRRPPGQARAPVPPAAVAAGVLVGGVLAYAALGRFVVALGAVVAVLLLVRRGTDRLGRTRRAAGRRPG